MRSSKRRESSFTILRQISGFLLCAALIVLCAINAAHTAGTASADGRAECVMELSTGSILHARNSDIRLPMASTTKIMTALIILEDCDPDSVITVPDQAVGVEGSSIYLKKGEIISIKDLLYGLILRSGNDAATALAIYHSGSIQKFAEAMNSRATKMGLENTNFANPSGLPDENHYTTAAELCKIACKAMKNPSFKEIVSTRNYSGEYRSYVNKNKILTKVNGANGVKTGYTLKAGRCLVSSTEREGMDVVCVVLNCPDMYERSAALIESAFSSYELKTIDGNRIFMCDHIPCKLSEDGVFLAEKGGEWTVKTSKTNFSDGILAGDIVGRLEIYCKNNLIFDANLYSIVNRRNNF